MWDLVVEDGLVRPLPNSVPQGKCLMDLDDSWKWGELCAEDAPQNEVTHLKTNVASQNWWLEDEMSF